MPNKHYDEMGCCNCGWSGNKDDLVIYDHRPACPKCLNPDEIFVTDEAKSHGVIAPTLDDLK